MCEEADLKTWAKDRLSRRQFGVLTGAGAVAACAPGDAAAPADDSAETASRPEPLAVTEAGVTFDTDDGTMDAFFVHPAQGKHPAVIFWPDIASLREAKRNMARRLAGEGYSVLVLNPYYRDVAGEQYEDFAAWVNGGALEAVAPYRAKHGADSIGRDAAAAAVWLDEQDAVDTDKGIGTQGYCMGGPFTVWSAAAVPGRIKAAASFHGGGLVRDDYDKSPHKVLDQADAAFLIAVAKDDDEKAPDHKTVFADAAAEAGHAAQVKVYDGNHGWTVPDAPAYDAEAAAQAYTDLLKLYAANL